jgi:hypothetical protein
MHPSAAFAPGTNRFDVRIPDPHLADLAHGRATTAGLPAEVVKEVQMLVFWLENAVGEHDLTAFPGFTKEGGMQSIDICGSHCLALAVQGGVITLQALRCK